jgi:hypothetical protein
MYLRLLLDTGTPLVDVNLISHEESSTSKMIVHAVNMIKLLA